MYSILCEESLFDSILAHVQTIRGTMWKKHLLITLSIVPHVWIRKIQQRALI